MSIQNNDTLNKLRKSGLNDKESLVYLSLLELGGAYPSQIAKYTGLNRTTVYDVLLTLSIKGLTNEIKKKNKQFYQPENPRKLVAYAKSKIAIAETDFEKASTALPDLEGIFKQSSGKPKVFYFEGMNGILEIYTDHISVNTPYEMKAWAKAEELERVLPEKFFTKYRKTKEQKGITTRGILPLASLETNFISRMYADLHKSITPKVRYMPANMFPYRAEITIYGTNRVSIVNLDKENFSGVIIEDETIHGLMSMIFELSWTATSLQS